MMRIARTLLLFLALGAPDLVRAEITPTVVHSFDGDDGWQPMGALVDGGDGYLYGTTMLGGTGVLSPAGTVYRITPAGDLSTLYTFEFQITGDRPFAGVLRLADGTLFGTTRGSGSFEGNVFRLDTGGFTNLHNFTGNFVGGDGGHPEAPLVEGGDGNLYGTTIDGGAPDAGTIYRIDALGGYTLVHPFSPLEGVWPRPLVLGDDGHLYGVAAAGAKGSGTVFRFTPGSSGVTVLHEFASNGSDGSGPTTLVKGLDGALYGTTGSGGTSNAGTLFRITTSGDFESLYSFTTGSGEGNFPVGLTVGSDGNLYGVTSSGGEGIGAAFRVRPNGAFTTLFAFPLPGVVGGSRPEGALAQLGDKLYGTTSQGGTGGGKGTVFRIDGLTIAAPEPEGAVGAAAAAAGLALAAFVRRRRGRSR